MMSELSAVEGILKAKVSMHMTQDSTFRSQTKGKGKKRRKRTKQADKEVAQGVNKIRNKAVEDKQNGKCFHSGEARH